MKTQPFEIPTPVAPSDGEPVPALNMVHKVNYPDLGGLLLVMEGILTPGAFVHPHTHTREDECTYILEGTLTFLVGERVSTHGAGSYIPKPRGIPHAFWNSSTEPARAMEMHTPATFQRYYDELGVVFSTHPENSPGFFAAFDALAAKYGLLMHWDMAKDLQARYGAGLVAT
ncbi:cupin domain-containing protein [Paeniglutamicibacter psychrophenolicus]|uniref:cupin domain-containing protein n=1 Tax=Paeniglutamicibacter psychrophenolicus TaxID=257454 RepID=UPI002782765E|nr:cupin domain-containing protein [Paeniglutamicibacter psychrophenolicus]MDQ0096032.1 quercetin dioxygenase-like cupin family protein [Paeniglutamicibacter psychrophenolicus]